MEQTQKTAKFFSWLFLSTGVFAIVGALYTWGEGPIYLQKDLLSVLIPWADLLLTGPLSFLAAIGVLKRKPWGFLLGLMVCGMYLFGSALVYISLVWAGGPYPAKLVFPPVAGIAFSLAYPIWILKHPQILSVHPDNLRLEHAVKRVRGVEWQRS